MKKVLITGVTGFVGQYLAELLIDQDAELHGTYHSDEGVNRLGDVKDTISLYKVDLTNKEQVNELIEKVRPDEVYHLAAQSSPSISLIKPEETLSTNIFSELFLLEALKDNDLIKTRVLIVTSADVYGKVEESDLPIDEDTSFNPVNPYAVSKITQDFLALQYFLTYNLQIVRARTFNHIGPRQQPKFVVPMFAQQIAEIDNGKKEPVLKHGNLDAKRDFTDVRDIVKAYASLMEKGVAGEVYNVGSGKSVSIKYVLDVLLSFSDKQITTEEDKDLVRPVDIKDISSDSTKLVELTGWRPEISLETTLKDTLDYFRKLV